MFEKAIWVIAGLLGAYASMTGTLPAVIIALAGNTDVLVPVSKSGAAAAQTGAYTASNPPPGQSGGPPTYTVSGQQGTGYVQGSGGQIILQEGSH